ncbi:MAG: hypothetical protein ACYCY0_03135 [Acidithiobacillus ferrivorans]
MSLDAAIIEYAKVGLTVMRPDVHSPSASVISRVVAGFPSPAD